MALDYPISRERHRLWPELSSTSSSTSSSTPWAGTGSQGASGPLGLGGLDFIRPLALSPSEMTDPLPLPLTAGEVWRVN